MISRADLTLKMLSGNKKKIFFPEFSCTLWRNVQTLQGVGETGRMGGVRVQKAGEERVGSNQGE